MAKPLTEKIEHIVVLMLENRSFDNVLGGLYPELTRRGLYRGLSGSESNSGYTVFSGPATSATWVMPYPDPGELYSDMVQQIFGSNSSVLPSGVLPPMSGFVSNYKRQPPAPAGDGYPETWPVPGDIMQYYTATTLPETQHLAQQYAVCDSWFAAAPVQTLSNRILTHCGTPSRIPNTNLSRINNPDYTQSLEFEDFTPPVTDTTIFQLLDNTYPKGKAPEGENASVAVNWKVYYHDAPLSALCKYVYDHWYDFFGGNVFYFYEYSSDETNFEYDIRNHMLPKYSFIEPRYSDFYGGTVNSYHPGGAGIDFSDPNGESLPPPIDVLDGESLLSQVYSILYKYPETFEKTLLIVTYDEHGGLFDHVPPLAAVSPFSSPVDNFNYDRYGVRVPAILINPYIPPRTVYPPRLGNELVATPSIDHTSILSTVMAQFEVSGFLSNRVSQAPQLTRLITDSKHEPRPPLVAHRPKAVIPPPVRLPLTMAPRNAHTLAGALGPLYRKIQKSKRPKRP